MFPNGFGPDVADGCDFLEGFAGNQQIEEIFFAGSELTHAGGDFVGCLFSFQLFHRTGQGQANVPQELFPIDGLLQEINGTCLEHSAHRRERRRQQ